MANAYPELPQEPYRRTTVPMPDVIHFLQAANLPKEVKRSTYVVFRIESANGQSGVNNNYAGVQADGNRWAESLTHYFSGTTTTPENQTGRTRIFLCFRTWQDCVSFLADRMEARGLYVGGTTHQITQMEVTSPHDLVAAYYKEWVTGNADANPPPDQIAGFLLMYAQAEHLFTDPVAPLVARLAERGTPVDGSQPAAPAQADNGAQTQETEFTVAAGGSVTVKITVAITSNPA